MSDFIFENAANLLRVSLFIASALGLAIWALVFKIAINRWRENSRAKRPEPAGRYSEIQAAIRRAEEGARMQ